jgi:hypothetical protein
MRSASSSNGEVGGALKWGEASFVIEKKRNSAIFEQFSMAL